MMNNFMERYLQDIMKHRNWFLLILLTPCLYLLFMSFQVDRFTVWKSLSIPQKAPVAIESSIVGYQTLGDVIDNQKNFFRNNDVVTMLSQEPFIDSSMGSTADLIESVRNDMSMNISGNGRPQIKYDGKDSKTGEMLVAFYAKRLLRQTMEGYKRSGINEPSNLSVLEDIKTIGHKALWRNDRLIPLCWVMVMTFVGLMVVIRFLEWVDPSDISNLIMGIMKHRKWFLLILITPCLYLLFMSFQADRFVVRQSLSIPQDAPVAVVPNATDYQSLNDLLDEPELFFKNSYIVTMLLHETFSNVPMAWLDNKAADLLDSVQKSISICISGNDRLQISYYGEDQKTGEMLVAFYANRLLCQAMEGYKRSGINEPSFLSMFGPVETFGLRALWRDDRLIPVYWVMGMTFVVLMVVICALEWVDPSDISNLKKDIMKHLNWFSIVLLIPCFYLLFMSFQTDRFTIWQSLSIPQDAPVALVSSPVDYRYLPLSDLMDNQKKFFRSNYIVTMLIQETLGNASIGWKDNIVADLIESVRNDMSMIISGNGRPQIKYYGKDSKTGEMLVAFYAKRLLRQTMEGYKRSGINEPSFLSVFGAVETIGHRALWRNDRLIPVCWVMVMTFVGLMVLICFLEWADPKAIIKHHRLLLLIPILPFFYLFLTSTKNERFTIAQSLPITQDAPLALVSKPNDFQFLRDIVDKQYQFFNEKDTLNGLFEEIFGNEPAVNHIDETSALVALIAQDLLLGITSDGHPLITYEGKDQKAGEKIVSFYAKKLLIQSLRGYKRMKISEPFQHYIFEPMKSSVHRPVWSQDRLIPLIKVSALSTVCVFILICILAKRDP